MIKNRLIKFFGEKTFTKQEIGWLILSGILMGLSFPPFPTYHFSFIAFVPFILVIERKSKLFEISRAIYITGFFFCLIALYWVGSWTKEADTFLMISGGVLIFFNPLTFMIPTTFYYLAKRYITKYAIYGLPLFWVFYEYIYSITDFRFPWLTLGHSLSKATSIIQISEIIGTPGLTFLIILTNVLIAKFIITKNKKFIIIPITAILLLVIYGSIRINHFENLENGLNKIKVGLIQPDFNPWDKWVNNSVPKQLEVYLDLSKKAADEGANLIIWPESALPGYLLNGAYEEEVIELRNFIQTNNVFLVTGMPDATFYYSKEQAPEDAKTSVNGDFYFTAYNAILGFSPNSLEVQKYRKIKLVPFGEFNPFEGKVPFIGDFIKWNVGISSWNVGKEQTVFNFNMNEIDKNKKQEINLSTVNCIESIFSEFVTGFVRNGAEVLAVVTNDSWYGYSSGPFQHKDFAAIRAVETRRFVVRAANGGISSIIDYNGIIKKSTELFTRTHLVGEVSLYDNQTFYTKYPWIFTTFATILTILVFIISLINKYFRGKKI